MKTRKPSARAAQAADSSPRRAAAKKSPSIPPVAPLDAAREIAALSAETSEPPLTGAVISVLPIRIGYFNPVAREIFIAGTFNQWDPKALPLTRDALGDWSIQLLLPPGEYRYRLVVDGEWRDDPNARRNVPNPFGGFDSVIDV
jgi:hypothetical protein